MGEKNDFLKCTITSSKRDRIHLPFFPFLHIMKLYPLNTVTLKVAPYDLKCNTAGNKSINPEIRFGKIGHLSGKLVALIKVTVGYFSVYFMLPRADFPVYISSRYLTGNLLNSAQQEKRVLLKTWNVVAWTQTGNEHSLWISQHLLRKCPGHIPPQNRIKTNIMLIRHYKYFNTLLNKMLYIYLFIIIIYLNIHILTDYKYLHFFCYTVKK